MKNSTGRRSKSTLLQKLGAGLLALQLAVFFSLSLMPAPAQAGLAYRQQPGGSIAHNTAVNVLNPEQVLATYDYGWHWSGPFYATPLTGTAGATGLAIRSLDTNVTQYYQGPLKVVFLQTSGTVYYKFQDQTYTTLVSMTATAASSTGIPLAANTLADSGVIWPGTSMTIQQLDTVTRTANSFLYWILDKNW